MSLTTKGALMPLPINPHNHPDPRQPLIHFLLLYFKFFLELYINGIVYYIFFFSDLFCSACFWDLSMLFHLSVVHSFLLVSGMEAICLLIDIWDASSLGFLQRKLLCTFMYQSLCGHIFSFHLDKYFGLNCWVIKWIFKCMRNAKLFPKWLYHLTFSSPVIRVLVTPHLTTLVIAHLF